MSQHPFDKLTLDNNISFIFTPCPGTKDVSINNSVSQLKSNGAAGIITLMYDQELEQNNATDLPIVCKTNSVQWFQLPIRDDAPPNEDFLSAWQENIADILALLNQGKTVAVHCKGGSGRTGLVIALIMRQLGYDIEQTKQLVQSIRPKALKHPAQLAYFENFS